MSLAQPCPPLLICSCHEACPHFRYIFVVSIKSMGHVLVGCPADRRSNRQNAVSRTNGKFDGPHRCIKNLVGGSLRAVPPHHPNLTTVDAARHPMAAMSPSCEFELLAACARSASCSARARFSAPERSKKSGHRCTVQRDQFSSCGHSSHLQLVNE